MSLSFYKLESFHWYIDYLWIIIIIFFLSWRFNYDLPLKNRLFIPQ